VGQLVDDGRECGARGGILDVGTGRTRHPAVEQRPVEQHSPRVRAAVDLRRKVVTPLHLEALVQRLRPGGR
jgi:hypothetical protein